MIAACATAFFEETSTQSRFIFPFLLELFLCVESLHAVRVSRDKPSRRTIEVLAALGLGRDRASDQGNLNPH